MLLKPFALGTENSHIPAFPCPSWNLTPGRCLYIRKGLLHSWRCLEEGEREGEGRRDRRGKQGSYLSASSSPGLPGGGGSRCPGRLEATAVKSGKAHLHSWVSGPDKRPCRGWGLSKMTSSPRSASQMSCSHYLDFVSVDIFCSEHLTHTLPSPTSAWYSTPAPLAGAIVSTGFGTHWCGPSQAGRCYLLGAGRKW